MAVNAYIVPNLPSVIYTSITVISVYVFVRLYAKFRQWEATYDRLPGRRPKHWFMGNLNELPGEKADGVKFNLYMTSLYPRLYRLWIGRCMCRVIFHHPDTVKLLLKTSAPKPRGFGAMYNFGRPWLGDGLLMSNGDKWSRTRKLLTPAFHQNSLKTYLPVINASVDILLNKLSNFSSRGDNFEAFTHIGLCSLDVICQCAFSYETDCQIQGTNNPYVNAVSRLSALWVKRALSVWSILDVIYFNLTRDGREFRKHCLHVHGVAESIIRKRRATLENASTKVPDSITGRRYLDFLDILLTARDEEGAGLGDNEIRDEVDTFLFAGHDSTSSGISFTLVALAEHPEVQARAREEVDELFGNRDTESIEWNDVANLPYVTMCIKEALRHYSPVHFIEREVTEDLRIDEYAIPKGTSIAVNIHSHHHNELVWGADSHQYRPERFKTQSIRQMDPFAFIPFSAGPRNCIGQQFAMMEMKVMVARILHSYRLETVSGHGYDLCMGVVMKTEHGAHLKVTKIHR